VRVVEAAATGAEESGVRGADVEKVGEGQFGVGEVLVGGGCEHVDTCLAHAPQT